MKRFKRSEGEGGASAGAFICPQCAGAMLPAKCPKCAADVPPNYCASCGCCCSSWVCVACGQPSPAQAAAVEEMRSAPIGDSAGIAVGQAVDFELRRRADGSFEGIVDAIVNAEVVDAHGTVFPVDEILRLLPSAKIDDMHNFVEVKGVTHTIGEKVFKTVDGKPTAMAKITMNFDQAVEGARDAFQSIVDGARRGLSIFFRPTADAWRKVKTGVTNVVEQLEDIPFISLVDKPSCGEALILNYRRAPVVEPATITPESAPVDSSLGEVFREAVAAASEPPADPPAVTGPPTEETQRQEPEAVDVKAELAKLAGDITGQIASIEERMRSEWKAELATMRGEMSDTMRSSVGPEVGSVRAAVTKLEAQMRREWTAAIDALRATPPPRHVTELDPALTDVEPEQPAAATARQSELMGGSFGR